MNFVKMHEMCLLELTFQWVMILEDFKECSLKISHSRTDQIEVPYSKFTQEVLFFRIDDDRLLLPEFHIFLDGSCNPVLSRWCM